ncbi:hypothetical protein A0H81_00937 [Grifola frondosa]|uniref:Uncharacterized protein n=1 Tax=Grifola frondosa TaxID=5627 RepID=A0A1C7MSX6_GRIFR|nr:hypothetical protein A0H81_00937 [Grifola frondosa]
MVEQFALGIIAGTLSVATSSIVGASTPSSAKWIFAIICYVGAALQVLAFVAVRKEKPIFFRRYITLHIMITVAAFAVSAAWIILSATRHSQAKTQCLIDFFPNNSTDSTSASEGDTLCNIFPWADVGIMSGLWILLAIVQIYLYTVMSSYGSAQRRDHQKYNSLYDVSQPLNTSNSYPLTERSPWDSLMGDKMQQHAEPGGNTPSTSPSARECVYPGSRAHTPQIR